MFVYRQTIVRMVSSDKSLEVDEHRRPHPGAWRHSVPAVRQPRACERMAMRKLGPASQASTHTFSAGPKHDPESGSTSGPADVNGNTCVKRAGTRCLQSIGRAAATDGHVQVGVRVRGDRRRVSGQAAHSARSCRSSGRARSALSGHLSLHMLHRRTAGTQPYPARPACWQATTPA